MVKSLRVISIKLIFLTVIVLQSTTYDKTSEAAEVIMVSQAYFNKTTQEQGIVSFIEKTSKDNRHHLNLVKRSLTVENKSQANSIIQQFYPKAKILMLQQQDRDGDFGYRVKLLLPSGRVKILWLNAVTGEIE